MTQTMMSTQENKEEEGTGEPEEQKGTPRASNYLTVAQRMKMGKELREKVPRTSHSVWEPPSDRRDPVDILIETNEGRLPELVPIRHGRMLVSPLTHYRGAAALMAYDLSHTPSTGIRVQACGDAHLGNFGFFATPERNLVFDINDFDETLPAPWEWDVKRLVASLYVTSQSNGYPEGECLQVALWGARAYRNSIRLLSTMHVMDMFYLKLDIDTIIKYGKDKEFKKAGDMIQAKAQKQIATYVFPKITNVVNGHRRIVDDPPLVFHQNIPWEDFEEAMANYRMSLAPERRNLFDRYHMEDWAVKVVGVGSVGTRCALLLLLAEEDDPLLLQLKEAVPSVLEPYAGKSEYDHPGERVVVGQRTIQTASDILLGWMSARGHNYYIRQLKDMKFSVPYEGARFEGMVRYARVCGGALARAHARSGDVAVMAGYLGKGDTFERALAEFARQYAKQNLQDYEAMKEAAKSGRIEVITVN